MTAGQDGGRGRFLRVSSGREEEERRRGGGKERECEMISKG